jgi:cytochrome c peroxidase
LKVKYQIALWIGLACGFTACQTDPLVTEFYSDNLMEIPIGFPAVDFPEDNEFTEARWTLGKALFYDTRLSLDSSISCASCHKVELAFSDDVAFSKGVANADGTRNAPTLANVAYHPYYTREGGVATLEMQVLVPVQEHNEFDFNIIEIGNRLENDTNYQRLSQEAYGRPFDYYVITRAISNFERSLLSGNSNWDKKQRGEPTMNSDALKGENLFFSDRTNCFSCHGGFNFTNYQFQNNGLYEKYSDIGRKRLTGNDEDLAKFKVPTLRNIALTAPFMHDGSLQNLEEVIEHYNSGGKNNAQKSELIKPLNLTDKEKKYLLAFLQSLTDEHFIKNPNFKP